MVDAHEALEGLRRTRSVRRRPEKRVGAARSGLRGVWWMPTTRFEGRRRTRSVRRCPEKRVGAARSDLRGVWWMPTTRSRGEGVRVRYADAPRSEWAPPDRDLRGVWWMPTTRSRGEGVRVRYADAPRSEWAPPDAPQGMEREKTDHRSALRAAVRSGKHPAQLGALVDGERGRQRSEDGFSAAQETRPAGSDLDMRCDARRQRVRGARCFDDESLVPLLHRHAEGSVRFTGQASPEQQRLIVARVVGYRPESRFQAAGARRRGRRGSGAFAERDLRSGGW
jgi:hypothetical protein